MQLELKDSGILRKNGGNCDILFTNFGMGNSIKNLLISKSKQYNSDLFNIKIEGLINGNIGPNNTIYIVPEDIKDAIKIKLNRNEEITDFEITNINLTSGLMDLEIKHLRTCEGLSLKQTFFETDFL